MRRTKRATALAALAVTATLILGACASDQGGGEAPTSDSALWGGDLVVGTAFDAASYNANFDNDSMAPYINMNIFSKLVNYDDPSKTVFGDLADSWEVSEDGLTYTFILKEGVLWHDGEAFDSADVVWTYQSILDEGSTAVTYPYVSDIATIEALDELTVEVTLKKPSASFLMQLANYYAPIILPEHIYADSDPRTNPANLEPIGTGPFRFVEHIVGDRTVLERNEDYFGHVAYLDNLVFRVFTNRATAVAAVRAGEIGYSAVSPSFAEVAALREVPGLEIDSVPSEIFQWFGFNLEHPILSDVEVRHAIAQAIDTKAMNDIVYAGLAVPAETVFLSYSPVVNTEAVQPSFDVDAANDALDEAGYPRDADGTRFELRYDAWNTSIFGGAELAQVLKQQLAEVGIVLNITVSDFSLFTEKILVQHDFDLNGTGGLHGPDPTAYEQFLISGSGRNQMQYANPELDALFAEARQTLDDDARLAVYGEIQMLLAEDMPRMNLIEYAYLKPYRSEVKDLWWQDSATEFQIGHDQYNRVWLTTGSPTPPEGIED